MTWSRCVQKMTSAALALLAPASLAWAQANEVRPYPELFEAADIVTIAIPIERCAVDCTAFLTSTYPGRDSIPAVAFETRFRVVLCLKGPCPADTTFTLVHHGRRMKAEEAAVVKVGAASNSKRRLGRFAADVEASTDSAGLYECPAPATVIRFVATGYDTLRARWFNLKKSCEESRRVDCTELRDVVLWPRHVSD